MIAFLEQFGGKVIDRWLASLLLPGLLWLSSAAVALNLGWAHALDAEAAKLIVGRLTNLVSNNSAPQAFLLLAGVLGASAIAGYSAIGFAVVVRRLWTLPGHRPPARWLRDWRVHRWNAADHVVAQLRVEVLNSTADSFSSIGTRYSSSLAKRDSISLERPERPTWIGDRWFATGIRVHRAYGLDLTIAWPRLWTVIPDALRGDIAAAQLAYKEASTIMSWAVLYAGVGLFWWPALIITASLAVTGALKARDTTRTMCELVESTCDLYGQALVEQLFNGDPLTPITGRRVNEHLRRKDLPPK